MFLSLRNWLLIQPLLRLYRNTSQRYSLSLSQAPWVLMAYSTFFNSVDSWAVNCYQPNGKELYFEVMHTYPLAWQLNSTFQKFSGDCSTDQPLDEFHIHVKPPSFCDIHSAWTYNMLMICMSFYVHWTHMTFWW